MASPHESSDEDRVSIAIVETVASKNGVSPLELSQPLYHTVDTDALDVLCRSSDCRVQFDYLDYHIVVDENGHVAVEETNTE